MGEYEAITEAEYEMWTPPRAALRTLEPINRQNAMTTLALQMQSGALRLCAREKREVAFNGNVTQISYCIVRLGNIAKNLPDTFWAAGEYVVLPDALSNAGYAHVRVPGHRSTIYLHGLRFDPVRISIIAGQLGVAKVALSATEIPTYNDTFERRTNIVSNPDLRPKISHSQLLDWATTYFEKNSAVPPFAKVRDAARAAFPNLQITERPLKAVIVYRRATGTPLAG
jgi:hypothetical protein